jgi:coiled-coil domain-containing protein 130
MEQDFEPEFNDSIVKGVTDEERALLANDPMYRLQHEQEDKARATTANERLASLVELRDSQGLNDYNLNAALRAKNRERKRKAAELLREGEARGLPIPLVEESEQDAVAAKKAVFRASSANKFAQSERSKMTALKTQSIFKSSSIREKSGACSAVATTKVSAEVSKRKRLEVAMKKQAVVNINTRGLRLADMTKASVVSRVSAVRIDSKPLDNAAKLTKLSEAEPSTSDRAISLLQSAYGSDECDSN